MATDGELVLLALAAIGKVFWRTESSSKRWVRRAGTPSTTSIIHFHSLPCGGKVFPHQQMRQFVRHHFIDKRLLIFQQ